MPLTLFDFCHQNLIDNFRVRLTMGLLHDLPDQKANCTIFPGFKVIDTLLIVVQYRGNDRGQLSRIGKLDQPFFVNPLIRIGVMLNDWAFKKPETSPISQLDACLASAPWATVASKKSDISFVCVKTPAS